MKSNVARVVLVMSSLFVLAGAVLMGYMLLNLDDRNIINVNIGESGETAVDFYKLEINPGESEEYVLSIDSELPGDCIMTIDFNEDTSKVGALKDYVYVVVTADGNELCDCLLSELFEREEPLELPCTIEKRKPFEVNVKYYMPIEVGNEAENADSDFVIKITISNE